MEDRFLKTNTINSKVGITFLEEFLQTVGDDPELFRLKTPAAKQRVADADRGSNDYPALLLVNWACLLAFPILLRFGAAQCIAVVEERVRITGPPPPYHGSRFLIPNPKGLKLETSIAKKFLLTGLPLDSADPFRSLRKLGKSRKLGSARKKAIDLSNEFSEAVLPVGQIRRSQTTDVRTHERGKFALALFTNAANIQATRDLESAGFTACSEALKAARDESDERASEWFDTVNNVLGICQAIASTAAIRCGLKGFGEEREFFTPPNDPSEEWYDERYSPDTGVAKRVSRELEVPVQLLKGYSVQLIDEMSAERGGATLFGRGLKGDGYY